MEQHADVLAAPQDPSRRRLLKLGLTGTLVLGTAGIAAGLAGCHRREQAAAKGYQFLRDADLDLLAALAPVVLAGALPAQAAEAQARVAEILKRIDIACLRLEAPSRKQVRQLFDLLNFGLTRRLLAGVSAPWRTASAAELSAFLQRWRDSSIGLFNVGYRAIVKLCAASNFGIPASWPSSGYPGPLKWMYDAINR